jgi:uncharacterized Fe-S cluster-containing radical SAM superfamily enzyme
MEMISRKTLNLSRGTRIRAHVLELQSEGDLLVSYQENLIRVKNHTQNTFKIGDVLSLQVIGTNPLEFKIFERAAASFDRMV